MNDHSIHRLQISADASEEVIYIVAYLQDDAMLRLTYVIRKCRLAPIKKMTIPKLEIQAAVYGIRLGKQILSKHDVRIDQIYQRNNSSTALH